MSESLVSLMEKNISAKRGITFISSEVDEQYCSYADLYDKARRLLGVFQERGIGEGDEVVIFIDDNQSFLIGFWACLLGKLIAVPLSTGNQADRYDKFGHVWKTLNNPYLFTSENHLTRLKEHFGKDAGINNKLEGVSLIFSDELINRADSAVLVKIEESDIAYIQFSSGSTGEPKGVVLTHRNLVNNARDIASRSEVSEKDSMLSWMPLTHDMGLICFHLTGVFAGINQYLLPTTLFVRRPLLWLTKASEHQVSLLYSPNFGIQYFLWAYEKAADIKLDLSSVKLIYNGAEPISASLCEEFQSTLAPCGLRKHAIFPGYGLAEASVAVTLPRVGSGLVKHVLDRNKISIGDEVEFISDEAPEAVTFVQVGHPISTCDVRICDEEDVPVSDKRIGHIQIKGNNVTSRYYNNESATNTLFSEDGWLKTGDLGYMHEGNLVITGRLKNIIIINGQNYYPHDIERVICEQLDIKLGNVVACGVKKDDLSEEELFLFIVTKRLSPAALRSISRIPEVVATVFGFTAAKLVPVDKIPKTTSGKIQNFKLIANYRKGVYDSGLSALEDYQMEGGSSGNDDVKHYILSEIQDVLSNKEVTADASFFKLSLNSILATQLAFRIQDRYGVEVTVLDIFRNPSVARMAAFVEKKAQSDQASLAIRRVKEADSYPVSLAQRRLWGVEELDLNGSALNVPVGYKLTGALDMDALNKALNLLIEKYEILRTSFMVIDDELRQVVDSHVDFHISYSDYSDDPERDLTSLITLRKKAEKRFDLEAAPLMEVILHKLDEETHHILFNYHHTIVDGWSVSYFLKELGKVYNALIEKNEVGLSPLPWQFRDYVCWQRDSVLNGHLQKQRDYWLTEFRDEVPRVEFSHHEEETAGEEALKRYEIGDRAFAELRRYAAERECTPFVAVMSLVNALIYKITGESDIVIGTDASGRNSEAFNEQIGYFLNTLCIRTAVAPEQSFASLLKQVNNKVLAGFENQEYPYDQLLKDLSIKNTTGRESLFNILLVYQNFDITGLENALKGVKAETLAIDSDAALVDLHFEFIESGSGLELVIRYDNRVFTGAEVDKLYAQFQSLLRQVTEQDTIPVSRLAVLTSEDEKLLAAFNDTAVVYENFMPVHELFEQQAAATPTGEAIVFNGKSLTYEEVNVRANRLAVMLMERYAAGRGHRIGVLQDKSEELIISILAILKTGASYVPIDKDYPDARAQFIIKDSGLEIVLFDDKNIGRGIREYVKHPVQVSKAVDESVSGQNPELVIDPKAPAYTIYTSATTGKPKGVVISHRSVTDYVLTFEAYFAVNNRDRVVQQSSVGFDTFVEEVFPVLKSGGTLVIPNDVSANIEELTACIRENNVTLLSTTPLVINELNKTEWEFPSLTRIISGGDVLKGAYVGNILNHTRVYNTYGPSEVTVCATFHEVTDAATAHHIGRPIANHKVFIVDSDENPVSVGTTGQLCVSGAGLANGYLNLDELTKEKFKPLAGVPGEVVYRTGDLARWTKDGTIEFAGRKDFQVKIRGYRVEPQEVESLLTSLPYIEDACVIGDTERDLLVAYYVGSEDNLKGVKEYLAEHLPVYMIPHEFHAVPGFPRNAHGKVDRGKLKGRTYLNKKSADERPVTLLELSLIRVWEEVLTYSGIGSTDNFFQIGGDSIRAHRIVSEVKRQLGISVEIKDIFLNPTIKSLHDVVVQKKSEGYTSIPAVAEAADYPVSNIQKRIWILGQLPESSIAYNEFENIEIKGSVEQDYLNRSYELLGRKYEILRTTFIYREGEPRQVVHSFDPEQFRIETFDLREEQYPEIVARMKVNEITRTPMDMEKGPLMKLILFRVDEFSYQLTIVIHHIISDGLSGQILVNEFWENYTKLCIGESLSATQPAIQYRDYVAWLQKRLESDDLNEHKAYWLSVFEQPVTALTLPTDRKRPAVKQFNGKTLSYTIDGSRFDIIDTFCQRNGSTKFIFLMSVLNVLLSKLANQEDVVIGTPVAGRDHPDLASQLGLFINLIPIRTRVDQEASFAALLERVRGAVLESFQHQVYPVDLLIEELEVPVVRNRNPLFDIFVGYQTKESRLISQASTNVYAKRIEKEVSTSKFDLSFYFEEFKGDIQLTIEYDSDLFVEATINRFFSRLVHLIDMAVQSPSRPLKHLSVIPAREQQQLLNAFNNTYANLPEVEGIHTLIEGNAASFGAHRAVTCNGTSFTYKEIEEKAKARAKFLKDGCKLNEGDYVGVLLDRSEEVIISVLAIWKAGGVYVPIDTQYPEERIKYLLEDTGLKVLISAEDNLTKHGWLRSEDAACPVVCIDAGKGSETLAHEGKAVSLNGHSRIGVQPKGLAYVIYTSGSTGKPKGVQITHKSLTNFMLSMKKAPGMTSEDKLLAVTTYTFDISLLELFLPLVSGGEVLLATNEESRDPQAIIDLITEHGPSLIQSTPSLLQLLVNSGWENTQRIKVLSGGERLNEELGKRLLSMSGEVWNMYGPTETTIWSTIRKVEGDSVSNVGKPIDNTQVYVLDGGLNLSPLGVVGEVHIGGAGLAASYLNRPDLTKEKFIELALLNERRVYNTGDLGRWLESGTLEIIGRNDDQVKVRGHRIELGEIENALIQHKNANEAAVIVKEDETGDKYLVAFVVAADGDEVSVFRTHLAEKLPAYMVPSGFHLLEVMPKTSNGKIDRKALAALESGASNQRSGTLEQPETKTEKALAELWKEILNEEVVGATEDFFMMGGHSIKAINLIGAIEGAFNVQLKLHEVFANSTVRKLAALIDGGDKVAGNKLLPIPDQEYYAVNPSQNRFFMLDQLDDGGIFNLTGVHKFTGDVKVDILGKAFDALIARHESLRTTFEKVDGLVMQKVHSDTLGFRIESIDRVNEEGITAFLNELLAKEVKAPFSLSEGPLLRAKIIDNGNSEYYFIFTIHHIISDAWSVNVLIREVLEYYKAFANNTEARLQDLKVQSRDYSHWLNNELSGPQSGINSAYWLDKFKGGIPTLELPLDYPRPAVKTDNGDRIGFTIPGELKDGLLAVSHKHGTSLYMTLMACQVLLYYRYTSQSRLVIGAPIADRDNEFLKDQIGYYVNNIPLLFDFDKEVSFAELLEHTKQVVLDAYEHKSYPFDRIVDSLDIRRDLSRSVLYDVGFTWDGNRHSYFDDFDFSIEDYDLGQHFAHADIWFYGLERDDAISFDIEYNTDLFSKEKINSLIGHYTEILKRIAGKPEISINAINYLPAAEELQLTEAFNQTLESNDYNKTIVEEFESHVSAQPDMAAMVYDGQTLTYGELNARVNRLAHHLRDELSVGPDKVVGIMLPRSEWMVVSILAIMKAGGAYVPIDPQLPADRIAYIFADTAINTLIVDSSNMFGLTGYEGGLFAIDIEFDMLPERVENPSRVNVPDDLAYIIYTSGSTGRPKGVLLEHRGVINLTQWQRANFNLKGGSRIFQHFSYNFDGAVGETFMALLNGATLCMYSGELEAEKVTNFINTHELNVGVFVPSLLRQMDPSKISHKGFQVVSVGEACPSGLAAEWSKYVRFMNAYGPTEYTVYSHLQDVAHDKVSERATVPIGTPIFNTHTYILDAYGNPCGLGIPGELYLSGPGLARGYLNNRLATLGKFVANPYFLSSHYREEGLLRLEETDRQISGFKSEGFSLSVLSKGEEEYLSGDRDKLVSLSAELDKDIQGAIDSYLDKHSEDVDKCKGFIRYFFEAYYHSYSSAGINASVLSELLPMADYSGKQGVELGFGNGEVMEVLAGMGAEVCGIELSPYFVQQARNSGRQAYMGEVDLPPATFYAHYGIEKGSRDFSLSTLLMDRVEKPAHLVANLLGVLKDGGHFALQTLLPVIPVDDGDVSEKIVYTQDADRISLGEDVHADKLELIRLLYELGGREIVVRQLPYVVASRDGIQDYTLWSFSGVKSGAADEVHSYTRMYRSGDVGYYLPDGSIEFQGRVDDQIKLRGYRIELGEISRTLEQHEQVAEAVVIVHEDDNKDKSLHGFYRVKGSVSEEEARSYLKGILPVYMVPTTLTMVESFPLNSSGKVNKHALLELVGEEWATRTTYVAPRTETEELLVAQWEEVLGRKGIGVLDNFFEAGGHSLKATRMISNLYKLTGVQLDIGTIFKYPTIEELAVELEADLQRPSYPAIEPVEEAADYELSAAQRRLWILDQMDDAKGAYNIASAHRFRGKLDKEAFGQAFTTLVDRHESLRTTFEVRGGEPRQVIHSLAGMGFAMEYIDLRERDDKEAATKQLVSRETGYGFDLSAGPLFRATLVHEDDDEYLFLLTMHHIVSDGWSMKVLVEEVLSLYEAYSRGEGNPLAALEIQYKDYAHWQNELLSGPEADRYREFWMGQELDKAPVLELPSDYPRPAVKTFNGAELRYVFGKDTYEGLQALSKANEVSLFIMLTSLVKVFLYKYTGQNEIIIGTPTSGREFNDLNDQIGIYINTVPLFTRLEAERNYEENLKAIKETCVNSLANQIYPFDTLVDDLDIKKDLSRSALFDVILSFQNEDLQGETVHEFGGISVEPYPYDNHTSKFDLSFSFTEADGKLELEMGYNTDLFTKERIERLFENLNKLAGSVIGDQTQPLHAIDILPADEQEKLLKEFNSSPEIDVAPDYLFKQLALHVNGSPQAPAVCHGEECVSYQELDSRSNQVANYLQACGVKRGEAVGLFVHRSADLIVAMIGILKAGAIYVPLDDEVPQERLKFVCADAAIHYVITHNDLKESVPADLNIILIDNNEELSNCSDKLTEHAVEADSGAYIIYTSGSTGKPKGVLVSHGNLSHFLFNLSAYGLEEETLRMAMVASPSFDISIFQIFTPLLNGGTLNIIDKAEIVNADKLVDHLRKVNVLDTVPAVYSQIVETIMENGAEKDYAHIRKVFIGGDKVSDQILNRLSQVFRGAEINVTYGPTEGTIFCTSIRYTQNSFNGPVKGAVIGRPLTNTKISILDSHANLVPIGVAGEICIAGKGVSHGYLNREELTREKYIHTAFHEGRVYRTGDLGKWLPDGRIEILGRTDNQVKIRGFRIELGEIEHALTALPGIEKAVVMAKVHEGTGDKVLCAYYIPEQDADNTSDGIKGSLGAMLPQYMVPQYLFEMEEYPLTSNGKVNMAALPEPNSAETPDTYVAPSGYIESKLAEIWSDVLAIEKVGANANFFELGGHSLKATRLLSRIHNELGVNLLLKDLFTYPELSQLANVLKSYEPEDTYEVITKTEEAGYYELSYGQKRLWILHQLENSKIGYNMPEAYELTGDLDVALLEQSYRRLVERHEILRTRFRLVDGEVKQFVDHGDRVRYDFNFTDVSDKPDAREMARGMAQAESAKPFDLENGPLLKVRLVKVSDKGYVMAVIMHHIISDGWSMEVFFKDILAFYHGLQKGEEANLPALSIQYKDFARWQTEKLLSRGQHEKAYWLDTFQEGVPVLELPADYARPPVKSLKGSSVSVNAGSEIAGKIDQFVQSHNSSQFMFLMAAVNVLLHKYTAQEDIVLGTPVSGRTHAELEDQIGFYVNTLAIRNGVNARGTFEEHLAGVKEQVLAGYQHQSYPFDKLVEDLELDRDLGRNPLFDVMVALHEVKEGTAIAEGLTIDVLQVENTTSKFDLVFNFYQYENDLKVELLYSTDLFGEPRVSAMLVHFIQLLDNILSNPGQVISGITYLPAAEELQLTEVFNQTLESNDYNKTIVEEFESHVSAEPDMAAIVYDGQTLTYGELNARVNRLAHHLRDELSVGPDKVVGIMLPRSEWMVISILAIMKAGGAYVPIDPQLPADRREYICNDVSMDIILTQGGTELSDFTGIIYHPDTEFDMLPERVENPSRVNVPDDLAYIIYTSGSTGRPKGVLLEHRGVINLTQWQRANFSLEGGSRIFQHFSYNFDGAVGETFMALLNGATLCMYSGELEAEKVTNFINTHELNVGVFVPSLLRQMDPSKISHKGFQVVSVGEACPSGLAAEWSKYVRFMNAYGPTEYTVYSHLQDVAHDKVSERATVPIGTPIFNTHTYILDAYGNPCGLGIPGELYLSGPGLARGYLNNRLATLGKFVANPYFLSSHYREEGLLRLEETDRQISGFKSEGFSLSVLSKGEEEYLSGDRDKLVSLSAELDKDIQGAIDSYLDKHSEDVDKCKGFIRYFFEAYYHSYSSAGINASVLSELLPMADYSGKQGVELGFGNGEVMEVLAGMGAEVCGIELSPYFVQQARNSGRQAYMGEVDLPPATFYAHYGIEKGSRDFSLSTLLMDRVEKPAHLVANLLGVLKDGGHFALQTLLPVIPVDDGDVSEKIVYTQDADRISLGEDVHADKLELIRLLYELGGREIVVRQLPYVVASRDGIQDYTLWSFSGVKSGAADEVHSYTRMYRSGDVGYYLPDGSIEFQGRVDDQIKLRGYRIELGEISRTLEQHEQVAEAVVIVHEDDNKDKSLHGFYRVKGSVSEEEARSYLKGILPVYMVPTTLTMVESFPLNSSGKVNKHALLELVGEEWATRTTYVAPRTETEELLVAQWEEVLGRKGIGVLDNFFEAGGHSLKATRMISNLYKLTGVQLDIGTIFKYPTIEELAVELEADLQRPSYPAIEPVEEAADYELSAAQRRLWILDQMDDAKGAYNIASAHRFRGKLDKEAFGQAFTTLVDRHESLRTTFEVRGGEPRQVIHSLAGMGFAMEYIDLRERDDKEAATKQLVSRETGYGFDLSAGPLFRATLVHEDDDAYLFLLTMHHIVSDGWSMKVLVEEVLSLYEAYSRGEGNPLAALEIQYKDYAHWQNELLSGPEADRYREFWMGQELDKAAKLELPVDLEHNGQAYLGKNHSFELDGDMSAALVSKANSLNMSTFSLLVSAFKALMYRYTGQSEIVVGTPVSGREVGHLENQIGFYVNVLPVMTKIGSSDTLNDVLLKVKSSIVSAFNNQLYPYDLIVKELNLTGEKRNSLFNVLMTYAYEDDEITIPGIAFSSDQLGEQSGDFPLDIKFSSGSGSTTITGSVNYDGSKFSSEIIEEVFDHYQTILSAIIEKDETALIDLDLTSGEIESGSSENSEFEDEITFDF
ncbi:non-ribosomal peptide synthase/polyketide synthase [Roseivirga sp. BDSF3-8]|uniref:non-ribosomal peptide synthase/polyketide synthase n=1 Tax=Roseivirga sp. BDSF3-8 TaxID=3241598 RepID=UPI003531D177